jgi:hypothetical protein
MLVWIPMQVRTAFWSANKDVAKAIDLLQQV